MSIFLKMFILHNMYRNAKIAIVILMTRGSWNRSRRTGHRETWQDQRTVREGRLSQYKAWSSSLVDHSQ